MSAGSDASDQGKIQSKISMCTEQCSGLVTLHANFSNKHPSTRYTYHGSEQDHLLSCMPCHLLIRQRNTDPVWAEDSGRGSMNSLYATNAAEQAGHMYAEDGNTLCAGPAQS